MSDTTGSAAWEPSNMTELAMAEAVAAEDTAQYFRIVESADLYLPAFAADHPAAGCFVTRDVLGVTYLLTYASLAALADQVSGVANGFARISYADLLRDWPDPDWRLAINQGTPIEAHVRIDAVAALARGDLSLPTFDSALMASVADAGLASLSPDEVDSALVDAVRSGSADGYVAVLMNALVRIPTTVEVACPADLMAPEFPWRAAADAQPPAIYVFTSNAAMASVYPQPVPHVVVPMAAAVAAWPLNRGMVVNPHSPHRLALPAHQVQLLLFWETAGFAGPANLARPAN